MGTTIAEKILARAADVKSIAPGDIADVEVDTCVLSDMNFMPASWRHILKMKDPARVVVVLDHLVPANEPLSAAAHTVARAFMQRFGIKRFHDLGRDQGISHVVATDNAYALPGTVMVNPDSHTCGGGAFIAPRAAWVFPRRSEQSQPDEAGSASARRSGTSLRAGSGRAFWPRTCS